MIIKQKQIDMIIRNTPKELKGKQLHFVSILGYFQPLLDDDYFTLAFVEYKKVNLLVVTKKGKIL